MIPAGVRQPASLDPQGAAVYQNQRLYSVCTLDSAGLPSGNVHIIQTEINHIFGCCIRCAFSVQVHLGLCDIIGQLSCCWIIGGLSGFAHRTALCDNDILFFAV